MTRTAAFPLTLTDGPLYAYLRTGTGRTTHTYDVERAAPGAGSRIAGRMVRRDGSSPTPGWFVSVYGAGVLRDTAGTVRYLPTPEAALAAMRLAEPPRAG